MVKTNSERYGLLIGIEELVPYIECFDNIEDLLARTVEIFPSQATVIDKIKTAVNKNQIIFFIDDDCYVFIEIYIKKINLIEIIGEILSVYQSTRFPEDTY